MTLEERHQKFLTEHPTFTYESSYKVYINTNRIYLHKSPLEGKDRTREIVRKRDGYTCQNCKKVWREGGRRFDVHRLNGLCGKKSKKYDKVSEIEGLITLCHKCHFNHPEHSLKLSTG